MTLRDQIVEIVDKVYREGSFEGEHPEIHPDRITPAVDTILALIEKELITLKKELNSTLSSRKRLMVVIHNNAVDLMRLRLKGEKRWIYQNNG